MPYGVTHLLVSVVAVDIVRSYFWKKKFLFDWWILFVAGFFAVIPDIDILFKYVFQFFQKPIPDLFVHRSITHAPLIILIFVMFGLIFWKFKKHKTSIFFFIAGFGLLTHLVLDFFISGPNGGIMLGFPFSLEKLNFFIIGNPSIYIWLEGFNVFILLAWILNKELNKKFKR